MLFITFEGIDGSGKTTQVKLLSDWMKNNKIDHVLTKEPGCPFISECVKIRELLLNPENILSDKAELLLFLADRNQHVELFIKPNLKNKHVICDRFLDSTQVYQSLKGLNYDQVKLLNNFVTENLIPDLTFVLDVPIEVGLRRAKEKSIYKGGDRMELLDENYFNNVRNEFLKLAKNENRFRVINAAPPKKIEDTHKEIINYVLEKL